MYLQIKALGQKVGNKTTPIPWQKELFIHLFYENYVFSMAISANHSAYSTSGIGDFLTKIYSDMCNCWNVFKARFDILLSGMAYGWCSLLCHRAVEKGSLFQLGPDRMPVGKGKRLWRFCFSEKSHHCSPGWGIFFSLLCILKDIGMKLREARESSKCQNEIRGLRPHKEFLANWRIYSVISYPNYSDL